MIRVLWLTSPIGCQWRWIPGRSSVPPGRIIGLRPWVPAFKRLKPALKRRAKFTVSLRDLRSTGLVASRRDALLGSTVVLHSRGCSNTVGVMTTITCKLPEALDAELEAVAEKRGVSKSEVVREAIEANLPEQKRRSGLTAFDVMKSACGILQGGPSDLATHPRHLEGFGRD